MVFVGYGMIGGICVNIGCVFLKVLIWVMEVVCYVNDVVVWFDGIESGVCVVDWVV